MDTQTILSFLNSISINPVYSKNYADIEDILFLALSIMAKHPIYGQKTQEDSQLLLKEYLEENGWQTYLDDFKYQDIEYEVLTKRPWLYNEYYNDYRTLKRTNLYAVLDSKVPGDTIILNGHIDVDILNYNNHVNNIDVTNDRIYGRGSADMLLGLCTFATINSYLKHHAWKGKIIFSSVVDEEIGGNGTVRFCQWLKYNAHLLSEKNICFIGEPTSNICCSATLGMLPFKFNITGVISHINTQEQPNVIDLFREVISEIQNMVMQYDCKLNIGKINGGYDPSLPIPNLTVEGIISLSPQLSLTKAKSMLHEICQRHGIKNIEYHDLQIEPYFNQSDSYKEIKLFESACDASIFSYYGIPTVVWGPGNLSQAHSEKEYIVINDLIDFRYDFFKYILSVVTK